MTLLLFCEHDGGAAMRAQVERAGAEVDFVSEERILNTDPDALVRYFVDKYHVEVPTLDLDNVVASEHEQQFKVHDPFGRGVMTVRGTAFDFEIAFAGDAAIFQMRPSTYDSGPPHATVRGQSVCFSVVDGELTGDKIRQEFESTRDSIQSIWPGIASFGELSMTRSPVRLDRALINGVPGCSSRRALRQALRVWALN